MRVLRLGLGDDHLVDLHPSTSLVTGLTGRQRDVLRRGFAAIGAGLAPGTPGLIESHGVLLDASQDDLDLLEAAATPVSAVATLAEVPGAVPAADAEVLRTAGRDLLLLATDRWRACRALAHAEVVAARPTRSALLERAGVLRARVARHEARDAEPVRIALDALRDRRRHGGAPDGAVLVRALAGVGIDVADLGLPLDECVRIAEDWLEERRHEAAWVVGAGVELRGIEASLAVPDDVLAGVDDVELDELRRRAGRAVAAHAEAVDRVEQRRSDLERTHRPRPDAAELERHLVARLDAHRPDRLAGAVPLLLDGVLGHLDGPDVVALLARLAEAAGPVQLVVADGHPAAQEWVDAAGAVRAAAVAPSRASLVEAVR